MQISEFQLGECYMKSVKGFDLLVYFLRNLRISVIATCQKCLILNRRCPWLLKNFLHEASIKKLHQNPSSNFVDNTIGQARTACICVHFIHVLQKKTEHCYHDWLKVSIFLRKTRDLQANKSVWISRALFLTGFLLWCEETIFVTPASIQPCYFSFLLLPEPRCSLVQSLVPL